MTAPSTVVNALRVAATAPVVVARRATGGPVLLRLIAVAAAVGAAATAAPLDQLVPRLPLFVFLVGTGAAAIGLFPRTWWVGFYLFLVVGLWMITTVGLGLPAELVRIGGLSACVYLTHSAAALAAAVPYDAMIPGRVLRRWAGRSVTVLVAGIGVGVGGVALIRLIVEVPSVVGPIVGSVVAAALAGLLVWHLRRRA